MWPIWVQLSLVTRKSQKTGKLAKNWWHRQQAKNEKWTQAKWIKIWQKPLVPPHISVNDVDKSLQDSQKIRRWVLGWRGDAIEIVVSLLPGLWAPPATSPPTTHNRWQKHELCPRLSSVWQHYWGITNTVPVTLGYLVSTAVVVSVYSGLPMTRPVWRSIKH